MEIDDLKELWRVSFDESDRFLELFFSTAYSPRRCSFLTLDGRLAAALHWLDCSCRGKPLAYLYAVATSPACRGRGLCRQLMEKTHRVLAGQGYAGTVLVPGDEALRAMYARMGYRSFGGMTEFTCSAGTPIPLRRVGPEEYAARRRALLSAGGVLQEGESLALLAGYTRLYAGEDLLLAASCDNGKLFVPELLGDPAAAPGVAAALGFSQGTFRTPGAAPFAMFHPLTQSMTPPDYFGLAFD